MKYKIIIFTLLLLSFVNGVEHTIVASSLSLFGEHFNATAYVGWFSISYTISSIMISPIIGFLANGKPLKNLFRIGFFLLLIGFGTCFIADEFYILIIGRVISGIGSGFISVLVPTFLGRRFALEKRAKVDSYNFIMYTTGTLIGPIIGAFIIHILNWRGIFSFSFIFFCVILVLIEFGMKENETADTKGKTDYNFILQSVMFSSFLLSSILLIEFFDSFHEEFFYYLFFIIPILLFSFFIKNSKKSEKPLFHPKLVKNRFFASAITYSFTFGFSKLILVNFLPIYVIQVLNHSFLMANYSLTMILIGTTIGNFITARLIIRIPYKSLFIFSYIMQHIALLSLLFVPQDSSFIVLIIAFLLGFANGFASYPGMLMLQYKFPDYIGSATSSNNIARHFGGVFGIVCFQQIVLQANHISMNSFQTGFFLMWVLFSILGLVIFTLPYEKLNKTKDKTHK